MSDQTPIPDIVAAFDADALTPEIIAAWAHHPHVCIGTLEVACIDALRQSLSEMTADRDKARMQATQLLSAFGFERDKLAIVEADLTRMREALDEARDALDNYSDVNDGEDGQPVANHAMSAMRAIDAALTSSPAPQESDQTLADFSAGYTQALDDALKGTP